MMMMMMKKEKVRGNAQQAKGEIDLISI